MTLRKFEARLRKAAKRTIPGLLNSSLLNCGLLHRSPFIEQNVGMSCATPAMFKHHRNLLLKCSE
jgi:folate-dependent tRNA-U54 methylase TrmFO/GidA